MSTDKKVLAQTLRQIAYDAGCALLDHADPETTRGCAAHYNRVCTRLRRLHPSLTSPCPCLPENASPGRIRMAARDAALYVERTISSHHFIRLAA